MVRKAVIPAAGLGTRFLPATKAVPKEMLPIVDRPLLQYVVEEAVAAGITDILLVTRQGKELLEDHFDRAYELEARLQDKGKTSLLKSTRTLPGGVTLFSVRQGEPLGLGHAVLQARNFVGDEPFAVLLPDEVFLSERPCLGGLIETYRELGGPVVGVQEVPPEEVSRYGIVDGEEISPGLYRVRGLVEKPPVDAAPSRWAIIGRYIITPDIFPLLAGTRPGAGGEIQLTDGLAALASRRAVYAAVTEGRRFDAGNTLGFLEATLAFALARPDLRPGVLKIIEREIGALSEEAAPTSGERG